MDGYKQVLAAVSRSTAEFAASQHCPNRPLHVHVLVARCTLLFSTPSLTQDLIHLTPLLFCISPIRHQLDGIIVCCSSSRPVALSLLVPLLFSALHSLFFASSFLHLQHKAPIAPPYRYRTR
ncbi:hypothetical protein V8C35DRAFT_184250 [Trichoderma chlorosporum]